MAALLAHFDPAQLQSASPEQTASAEVDDVLRNSTVIYSDDHPHFMLRSEVRRDVLESMGGADAMRITLQGIKDRPKNALQRMLDGYVLGRPKLLDLQNLDELAASLQVTQWFQGLLGGLPETADLERRIEREAFLKPFRDLAGEGFTGRADELAMLRSYVGFLDAEGAGEWFSRGLRQYVTGYRPLVIHAPGGMGKSTLVARFILDHLEPRGLYPALPFVYLDFDRPVLLPERVSTLIDEAARQLQITTLIDKVLSAARYQRWRQSRGTLEDPNSAIAVFSEFITSSQSGSELPVLFVLDTFEVVQYRGRDVVQAVLEFFSRMQRVLPQMRVVIASRAPITMAGSSAISVDNRPLGPLAADDAAAFLVHRGIDDARVARRVADQVGGSPLSLRLALEVVKKEGDALGDKGIRDLDTRGPLFLRLKDNQIQGQLYRRILNHVSNPDVLKLAHPGLVLRRLTPEIILDVLAGPCGVEVRTLERARELFTEMQREVSLVSVDSDGSLRHLPEVRAVMLDLLREDRPLQVKEIQERAVAFYRSETSLIARAELVYHLLMLQRSREEVDHEWTRGIEPYLQTAIDEVPAPSKSYLAARLDLPSAGQSELRLRDIEAQTARRVRSLLLVQKSSDAAALLASVAERSPGSVLYLLEAETRILTGAWRGAYEIATRGLADAAHFSEPLTILKLEIVRAWAERRITPPPSEASVAELRRVFDRFPSEMISLRFAMHRFAIATEDWIRQQMRDAIAVFFRGLSSSSKERYVTLCWEVAGAIGMAHDDILFEIVEGVGLMPLDELAGGPKLMESCRAWNTALSGRVIDSELIAGAPSALVHHELASAIAAARSIYVVPADVVDALAAVYREAADRWRSDHHLYEELEEGGRVRMTE
jgi:hypothetical protein